MKTRQYSALALMLAIALPLSAQETKPDAAPPEMTAEQKAMFEAYEKAAKPGEQHKQLEALVGTWTTKQSMWMDPSAPPMTETGTSSNTLVLGGRHLRSDFSSKWMGKPFTGIGYTGYDNVTGKFYSSWMDDASTGLFIAHGDYDAATKTYTFTGEMADAAKAGAKVPMREVLRIVDNDHHVFEMYETRDGKEAKVMQIEYARAQP
jgi:hypothetical protein